MKKIFLFAILLSFIALVACGDGSSSGDAKDDCTEDPALCQDNAPDPGPAE